jgi:hypothetical protein
MNSRVQHKLDELRRKTTMGKTADSPITANKAAKPDGLSMAIHSQKDAEQFLAELSAIRKRRTAQ